MVLHLVRIGGITLLLVLCMIYPFLPGKYDGLAAPLSTTAQIFSVAGLLLTPIGALWLADEVRKRARAPGTLAATNCGYYFALTYLITASILTVAVSLVVCLGISVVIGVLALAVWIYAVSGMPAKLKRLKQTEDTKINPVPFYLVILPIAALLFQTMFSAAATEFSRNYAIAKSAELINEIERRHAMYGRYPTSLQAIWKDYHPTVVGIEQYHYAPNGQTYNLFFEQPKFLLKNFGTREIVVYNNRDEHVIPSHVGWILTWSPEQLAANQGWYAVHDAGRAHWKYFWFD
jgi:hypothetical protein